MMHRGAHRPATILSRRTAARFAVTLGAVCLGWGGMSGLTVPGAHATAADPLRPGPPEIVHLVAVMAEFVPDTNRFTTGDGTFRPSAIP